ncbi:armadillo-type protein [Mycena galopus ATCC 62051]|nr:armadillo-type protein [Mycena galopus ATCC 62051]
MSELNGNHRDRVILANGTSFLTATTMSSSDTAPHAKRKRYVPCTLFFISSLTYTFQPWIGSRSGGVYMPPARLRALQAAALSDQASPEYQRLSWDALRKFITGIVNGVDIVNIKAVAPELFAENLIRSRGLFARSVMKAQASGLTYTLVFVALVAIINTKLPQFRRAFKRNDKIVCQSTTTFIAHLVNQSVAHEIIALRIMVLLIECTTEIAVGFMRQVGAFLAANSPKANATVFERFRTVLNEGSISQHVQYMIEVLMQVRKDKHKDNPILPEGLDLLEVQEGLNIFKFDPNCLENEEKYKAIKAEILGEDENEESGSEESSEEDEDEVATKEGIEDRTETNLDLRRAIYLSIMNTLNSGEAIHKLLKVQLQKDQEIELVDMIIECCSQERSYSTFYGLVGERFSKLNCVWTDCFEQAFGNYHNTIHRYETNLRNIARFFGHLASDAISWLVLDGLRDRVRPLARCRFRNPEICLTRTRSTSSDSNSSDSDSDSSSDSSSTSERGAGRRSRSRAPPRRRAPSDSRSPPRRRDRDDSPPRRRSRPRASTQETPHPRAVVPLRELSATRYKGRDLPPPRREHGRDDSRSPPPPPRRRDSRSPPREREKDVPPPRRRFESPPRRGGANGNGVGREREREREQPPHVRPQSVLPDGQRRRGDSRERVRSPPPPRERRRADSRERDRGYEHRR